MIIARTLWVLAIALVGCYGARSPDEDDGLTGNGVFSERAGQPAPGTAGKAGDPKPGAAGKSAGAGGTGGGATTGMSSNDVSTPPPQWISVDTQCGYVFKAPPDYVDQTVQGSSDCALGFRAGDCVYSTGFGSWNDSAPGLPEPPDNAIDVMKRQVRIDGYDATLLTYSAGGTANLAHVWFPKLPNGVGLQIGAICRSSAGPYEASMLYRSLHFAF